MKCLAKIIAHPSIEKITWGEKIKPDGSKREKGGMTLGKFVGVVDDVGYSFQTTDKQPDCLAAFSSLKVGMSVSVEFNSLREDSIPIVNCTSVSVVPTK